jgi:hypothetical protein
MLHEVVSNAGGLYALGTYYAALADPSISS